MPEMTVSDSKKKEKSREDWHDGARNRDAAQASWCARSKMVLISLYSSRRAWLTEQLRWRDGAEQKERTLFCTETETSRHLSRDVSDAGWQCSGSIISGTFNHRRSESVDPCPCVLQCQIQVPSSRSENPPDWVTSALRTHPLINDCEWLFSVLSQIFMISFIFLCRNTFPKKSLAGKSLSADLDWKNKGPRIISAEGTACSQAGRNESEHSYTGLWIPGQDMGSVFCRQGWIIS